MPTRRATARDSQQGGGTERGPDRNTVRRAAYAQVPGVAEAARDANRQRYHQTTSPPQPRLTNGLLFPGTEREVTYEEADHPVVVTSFTIPELARALGRSELTIRRWIDAEKIPGPYLRETTRQLRVYSIGEATTIATVLARHESAYAYLTSTNHEAMRDMNESMHAYRAHHV